MSGVIGIELGTDRVRAVELGRAGASVRRTCETPWDPARPADLVDVLRHQMGSASRLALSVGLGFLHVKHVNLPPVPIDERRRILALEPDRFFPVQGEPVVVGLASRQNLAFAADAGLVESWITAFEEWAPVDLVEPAPLSLARALGRRADGNFALSAGHGETGLVELRSGEVRAARRIPGEVAAPELLAPPGGKHGSGELLVAFGVARGVSGPLDAALLSESHRARIRQRRLLRTLLAGVACVASLLLAVWALDRSRQNALDRVRDSIQQLEPRAAPALLLVDRLAALDREGEALAAGARRRPDPLRVLAALSERLPGDVTVLSLRADGDAWQIDGRAADAAAILPALDGDTRFDNVRFLSASSRFREGDRTWETFSIAFNVRPEA